MRVYRVLHIEDYEGCSWVLGEALKEKNISYQWLSDPKDIKLFLKKDTVPDFVVCDGNIPYWPDHIVDVLSIKPKTTPMVVWTADNDLDIYLKDGIDAVFSKDPEGMVGLVEYIEELAINFKRNGDDNNDQNQQCSQKSNK